MISAWSVNHRQKTARKWIHGATVLSFLGMVGVFLTLLHFPGDYVYDDPGHENLYTKILNLVFWADGIFLVAGTIASTVLLGLDLREALERHRVAVLDVILDTYPIALLLILWLGSLG